MKTEKYEFEKKTTEIAGATMVAGRVVYFGSGVTKEIGVVITPASSGQPYTVGYGGEVSFTKETHATDQALAIGDPVYWDATNNRITKTVGSNLKIGVAKEAAASTSDYASRISLLRFTENIGAS
jgi:predicted RecA/RadA family phage recombinase